MTEQRTGRSPMLAVAAGFAAVILIIGATAALLTWPDADSSQLPLGGQSTPSDSTAVSDPGPAAAAPILVVVFADHLDEPTEEALGAFRSLPGVAEVVIVDRDRAEEEIRAGMAAAGRPVDDGILEVPITVRLRLEHSEALEEVADSVIGLEGVVQVDSYVGTLDRYPAWSGDSLRDAAIDVTTTTVFALSTDPPPTEAVLPPMTFDALDGAAPFELANLDRDIVIFVWAPWCLPCASHLASAADIAALRPEVDVIGLAVHTIVGGPAETTADLKGWLTEHGPFSVTNYRDTGEFWSAIGGYGLPLAVVVDTEMNAHMLYGDLPTEGLLELIDSRTG